MGGYQNFLRRMNAGGNTVRNEQIENALHLVRHTFADDPSYIPDGVQVWNSERILHPRIYQETYRSTSPEQARIQTLIHEPIYKGDVIPWPKHGYWMCLEANNLHDIQYEGTMRFCNYRIKFYSPLTGEIVEYPVSILNSTQYGSGETERYDDEFRMTIGTTQMLMYITYDKHTVLIDNGFRLLVDRNQVHPTAYVIKQADTVSYSDAAEHGFISFTLYEDQFNPKVDNAELMIADYISDPVGSGKELEKKPDLWI